ncbi:DUF5801 repeats-in-toxin domain-containing protein, partial [Bradyrhizobium viridifuturi]|uniref:DUF5801 repeats-in-toxin domain-containing protein n=1 Tax=Bradyrhizobium viridifuturi TaxID=1654716 RepID=UPI000AE5F88C
MQGSFQVAQATGTGNSTNSAPVRIYKLTKPLTDQAVVVNLGYDQKVKVDFSSIANEKITLVHIGEKLIILFDNQSTVTVEPFFDSRTDGQHNITIEMAPGRDVSVQEFASLFPIGTDGSVLPAADNGGNSNGNAQASGANFSPFAVDPLAPVGTNALAGNEELPGFTDNAPTGFVLNGISPAPTISLGTAPDLAVDESFLTVATNGVAGSGLGPAGSTVATGLMPFSISVPGGEKSLTFALSVSAQGVDSGLIDSQTGNHVFLFLENGQVVGREGGQNGLADFTISVDATGHITLTDLRAMHEGAGEAGGDINEGVHLPAGMVTLTATVTDLFNQTGTATADVGPHLTFLDDGPLNPTVTLSGVNPGELLTFDGGLAGGNFTGTQDVHDTNASATVATENFSGAFTFGNLNAAGADGGTTAISYTLGLHAGVVDGSASGLTHAGSTIFVYDVGGVITGSTSATAGGINAGNTVFTLSVGLTTGIVTLTQFESIDHSQTDTYNGSYINDIKSLAANLIDLKASAVTTDNDGDTSATISAVLDLGGNVQFGDDGPKVPTVTLSGLKTGELLTFDGGLAGGNFTGTQDAHDTNASATVATEDFSTAFTIGNTNLYGADGAGATTIDYTLGFHAGVADGVDSGLTHAGSTIYLYDVGGVITGSTSTTAGGINAGNTAFTLSVDLTTGIVTLTQLESIDHSQTDTYNGSYI